MILLLKRELVAAIKNPSYSLNPLLFFVISTTLFPLAISPEEQFLSQIAPGIIWVCVILSVLLSLNMLFYQDYENGVLEQIALSNYSFNILILTKIISHWLITGLPIIIISPVIASSLFLNTSSSKILVITLILGTPSLSLIGSLGAALSVSIKNAGMLIALIVLPLYIPILIFAVSAITNDAQNLDIAGQLYFLAFILTFAILIVPTLTKIALKINLD